MKMIKTPKYWEMERYQPLVEVKTMYGNTVQIPRCFEGTWKVYYEGATKLNPSFPQKALNGALKSYTKSLRSITFTNLLMVFQEKFEEDEYTKRVPSILNRCILVDMMFDGASIDKFKDIWDKDKDPKKWEELLYMCRLASVSGNEGWLKNQSPYVESVKYLHELIDFLEKLGIKEIK